MDVLAVIQFAPLAWKAYYAATILVGLGATVYNIWRENPNADLAATIRESQTKHMQAQARRELAREQVETDMSMSRRNRLQNLMDTSTGLDQGYVTAAQMGIQGGGLSERDMPMINQVAAQLGMDPADLAAKFDPTRVDVYTPRNQRGNDVRPDFRKATAPENIMQQRMPGAGPDQLAPPMME